MKIGIMSMQRVINYGSLLQAYGLKNIIESFGNEVEFVDYRVGQPLVNIGKKENFIKKIITKKNKLVSIRMRIFNRNFTKYYSMIGIDKRCYNYNSNYDVMIIGSDEVFNCCQESKNVGYSLELFGYNCEAKKLISYAASFGNTTLSKLEFYNKQTEVAWGLNRFDEISVRDENSKSIICSITDKIPSVNIDPVLLYDFSKDSLFNYVPDVKYKHIIIYAYPLRITDEECESIRAFAKKNNYRILTIGGIQKIGRFVACSPYEILGYFKNAEYIITDTFHGTIFSIVTKAKFVTIVRDSENNNYGNYEKVYDLLNKFELVDRIVGNIKDIELLLKLEIDYEKVDNMLDDERKKAIDYLKEYIAK